MSSLQSHDPCDIINDMTRQPVVAGRFYSAGEAALRHDIESLLPTETEKQIDAKGVICPHAGYMYSGSVAAETLSAIKPKPVYIILGPNHTGAGEAIGVDLGRSWKTPLGNAEIDRALAEAIIEESEHVLKDAVSHDGEHSIEVVLPFLQYFGDFKFVPICVSSSMGNAYKEIGSAISNAVKKTKKDVTVIASSDMTHYETQGSAKKKDELAINEILNLDALGLLKTVTKNEISMCGVLPAAIMIEASRGLGARKAKLVKYATSGDTSGDCSAVVGYAGIVVY